MLKKIKRRESKPKASDTSHGSQSSPSKLLEKPAEVSGRDSPDKKRVTLSDPSIEEGVLKFHFTYVAQKLPPDDVAPLMLQEDLLTQKEHDTYRSMRDSGQPEHSRSEYLLRCLPKRRAGFLGTFCKILRSIKAAEHIAECLEGEYNERVETEESGCGQSLKPRSHSVPHSDTRKERTAEQWKQKYHQLKSFNDELQSEMQQLKNQNQKLQRCLQNIVQTTLSIARTTQQDLSLELCPDTMTADACTMTEPVLLGTAGGRHNRSSYTGSDTDTEPQYDTTSTRTGSETSLISSDKTPPVYRRKSTGNISVHKGVQFAQGTSLSREETQETKTVTHLLVASSPRPSPRSNLMYSHKMSDTGQTQPIYQAGDASGNGTKTTYSDNDEPDFHDPDAHPTEQTYSSNTEELHHKDESSTTTRIPRQKQVQTPPTPLPIIKIEQSETGQKYPHVQVHKAIQNDPLLDKWLVKQKLKTKPEDASPAIRELLKAELSSLMVSPVTGPVLTPELERKLEERRNIIEKKDAT